MVLGRFSKACYIKGLFFPGKFVALKSLFLQTNGLGIWHNILVLSRSCFKPFDNSSQGYFISHFPVGHVRRLLAMLSNFTGGFC
jgi:hypothetical protein